MKKVFFLLTLCSLAISLAGCTMFSSSNTVNDNSTINVNGVPETGTVIDVTTKNNTSIQARVGDVVYVKLVGQAASGRQWNFTSPVKGGMIMLKDHMITGLNDPKAANGQFVDEWWLKIEEPASFDIIFNYGKPGGKVEQTFKVSVVSQ